MSQFQADSTAPSTGGFTVVETPTYLLARDEDCENSFHSTADFMNMFLALQIADVSTDQLQVMLFDTHPDGPYMDLIQKAYSPNHAVIRPAHYQNKVILFRKIIFHLESPAGVIFPKVALPDPMRCVNTALFNGYRRFVLSAFGLLDVKPPAIPNVVLSLRHRTPSKNVGRVMANEEEVINILKQGNMMNLEVVDMAKMSYFEQLKLIRNTNVLVGIHGAGLMFIMFAADEAVLVEIHPSYRQDRHFRHASRVTGKMYLPLRAKTRETCQGSSDNVMVPIDEFKLTMDGALRLARSFDDGLSECGLTCNPGILALDKRLDPYYKQTDKKSGPVNTQFPCA
jgi:protein O-GlcNAc transferase